MTERINVSIEDHVAVVTLNRADKHNALDMKMFNAIRETGKRLLRDTSIRAVVLQGAGENFCAGIDTSIFQQGKDAISAEMLVPQTDSPANFFQRAAYIWREVPVPVICALSGATYGGGLQIALGADLRYAMPDARFSIMEIKWGIIPDMAISKTLTRCAAIDKIKELAWTGRVFDGIEAYGLGVVTALHDDPKQAALATAKQIAEKSPDAIRAMKRLFDDGWDTTTAQALQLEATLQLPLLGSGNQLEAVMANFERRTPNFADPDSGVD